MPFQVCLRSSFDFAGRWNCIKLCLITDTVCLPSHSVSTILRQQSVSLW